VTRTAGIVLCGGRSSRMGAPKAWLPFGAELMLPRVVRIVREAVGLVVVVAAPGQDVPLLPADVRVVRDEIEGRGPLGGLAAGLSALEGAADVVYLSSCDVPLLVPEFVRGVCGAIVNVEYNRSFVIDVAVPRVCGRVHPLAAAYRVDVLPRALYLLAANRFSMTNLLDGLSRVELDAVKLATADPRLDSLLNVNTPEDYEAALRELRAAD
jgi:molybdenum cofactor guanylyltransferase